MATSYRESAYRTASASGATHIGLLLLVYDALACDFQKAAGALARGDIAGRCAFSNHALLLLGHLEDWCGLLDDESLATNLRGFYGHLRVQLLHSQGNGTPESFASLASLVSETRAVWQVKERRAIEERNTRSSVEELSPRDRYAHDESYASSWSA